MEEAHKCCMSDFCIIAGDDATFKIDFRDPSDFDWEFSANDSTAMIISGGGIDDIVISGEINGKSATYYISSEITQSLLNVIQPKCSVRVYFEDGGRYTPIHKAPLRILEE